MTRRDVLPPGIFAALVLEEVARTLAWDLRVELGKGEPVRAECFRQVIIEVRTIAEGLKP